MSDTTTIAALDFDVSAAEAKLGELERQFKAFSDAAKTDKAAKEWASAAAEAVKKAEDALKKLQAAQADVNKAQHDAEGLFARGIGGGEAAEKVNHLTRGLAIFNNTSLDSNTRSTALIGSLGIMGRMAMGAAEGVLAFVEASDRSTAAMDVQQRAVDALGTSYDRTRAATAGAMTASEAFAIREQMVSQNIFTTDARMAAVNGQMREYAIIHGTTAPEAFSRFAAAAQSANNGALAAFNVSIDRSTPAADRLRVAMAQLETQARQHPVIPATATESMNANRAAIESLGHTILAALDPFTQMNDHFAEQARLATIAARAVAENRTQLRLLQNAARDTQAEGEAADRAMLAAAQAEWETRNHINEPMAAPAAPHRGGGGSGNTLDTSEMNAEITQRRAMAEDMRAKALESMASQRELTRVQAEETQNRAKLLEQETQSIALAATAQGEAIDRSIEDHQRGLREWEREQANAASFSQQFGAVFAANTEHAATAAQSFAATAGTAMQSATGALRSHFQAWVTGRETMAQAAQGIVHEVLLAVATESIVKALFNYGEGIAALASYNYPKAAQNFAAAGVYTAVAVLAGAGAAATVPSSASAAPSSGAGATPPPAGQAHQSSTQGSGGNAPITIIYNGQTWGTRTELHDDMLNGVREAQRRGGEL